MPDREFFSLRNTVPGVTFLLVILGINCYPIFQILEGTNQGMQLFLGILTIFTGSALGFLITQFWWGLFELNKKIRGIILKRVLDCIITKFTIANLKRNYAEAIQIFDFIVGVEDFRLSGYASRRWDVFHLLASTVFAIILGLGLGGLIRSLLPYSTSISELLIIIFTVIASVLLVALMIVNIKKCRDDYLTANRSIILSFEPDIIISNFSVTYFDLTFFRVSHPNVNLESFESKGVLTAAMVVNLDSSELTSITGISITDSTELKRELDELIAKNRENHRLLKL